jgi:TatD DNase family protein
VLQRAAAVGVSRMIVTGATLSGSQQALDLVAHWPDRLRSTAGVHPHHAAELDGAGLAQLRALLTHPAVAAVGECGLDYYRNYCPHDVQRAAFVQQLEIAAALGKPVFLHQRDAHADFLAIVREYRPRLRAAVAHCFTDTTSAAEDYLNLGLHIGITGWICDERRGQHLQEVVRRVPAGRLMLETDGPYLLPRDLPTKPASRRNEPAYLPHIAARIAAARGESVQDLANHTTVTALDFFAWQDTTGASS